MRAPSERRVFWGGSKLKVLLITDGEAGQDPQTTGTQESGAKHTGF